MEVNKGCGHQYHVGKELRLCDATGCIMKNCCGGGTFVSKGSGRWMRVNSHAREFKVCRRCYCDVQYRAGNVWAFKDEIGLYIKRIKTGDRKKVNKAKKRVTKRTRKRTRKRKRIVVEEDEDEEEDEKVSKNLLIIFIFLRCLLSMCFMCVFQDSDSEDDLPLKKLTFEKKKKTKRKLRVVVLEEEEEEVVEEEEEEVVEEEEDEDEDEEGICNTCFTKCSVIYHSCKNGHYFGQTCLRTVFHSYIKNNKLTFECPAVGENCKDSFSQLIVEKVVSPNMLATYENKMIAGALSEEVRHCHDCKVPGFFDDMGKVYFECAQPSCSANTCSNAKCGKAYHPNLTCEDAAAEAAFSMRNDEKYQLNLKENLLKGYVACSGCGVMIQKYDANDDCMKVKCTSCSKYTCMCCGKGIAMNPVGFDLHGNQLTAYTAHFKYSTRSEAFDKYQKDVEEFGEGKATMPCYTWPDKVSSF
jgi:hypothetical protein